MTSTSPNADAILLFLRDEAGRPVRVRELARLMGVSDHDYRSFRATVKELIDGGRLVHLKRGRVAPPDPLNLVVGTVTVKRGAHMFCRVDPPDGDGGPQTVEDLFIPPSDRMTALNGDRVLVRRHTTRRGPSAEGVIIKILERGAKAILGIYQQTRRFSYVVPDLPHPLREIHVPPRDTKNAKVGQQVVVVITEWDSPDATPSGKITDVLGFPDEPGVDIERVIGAYQLPRRFAPKVLAEARAFGDDLTAIDLDGREDFRALVAFTIDPPDAKDHDDAVSLERVGSHWRLGVHIADVTHYVAENSALDHEAYERGTSVYLVDRVIPMLPVRLSNDLCSLVPQKDRLTISCLIDLSDSGELVTYRFCNSVIRSRAKLSYDVVMEYFLTGQKNRTVAPLADVLLNMRTLSKAIRRRRFDNGSLDLDVPEAKVILDSEGHPERIELRHSDESHQLIEEFMLVANQCAAHRFLRRNLPCLYRVHAPPSPEKMEEFSGFAESLGLRFSAEGGVTPKKLARLLDLVKDDPRREMIHQILLRSLMKAAYQPQNVGHFGLAFPHYTHFTSPIRRYPDLWIHRHLKKIEAGGWRVASQNETRAALPAIGKQTSERERLAEEAERESVRIKQLEYLESHWGDEFAGRVSGFLEFGLFVSLEGIGADGLVRFSGIDDDYYTWEPERWRVRGRRRGRTFNLGDPVRVRLVRTDARRREIDLELADAPTVPPGKSLANRTHRARHRRRG
ncbi:MAG: ribonuclease R [candidate division Zixibacteria bacterium]|nr:ribonuclease R [candidate division Zixibacteria bacterium]